MGVVMLNITTFLLGIFMLVCAGILLAPLGTDGVLVGFGIIGGTLLIRNSLC